MMGQEVRLYASYRSWYCGRTKALFRHRRCNLDLFGTSHDAEPGDWLARFMEEENRR
jgi:hypothetical protein